MHFSVYLKSKRKLKKEINAFKDDFSMKLGNDFNKLNENIEARLERINY